MAYKRVDVQAFTADTSDKTWRKPTGPYTQAIIILVGGGGGGGAGSEGGISPPSGGRGGARLVYAVPLSLLGATETVTIGDGATGQPAGGSITSVPGGNTSVGAFTTSDTQASTSGERAGNGGVGGYLVAGSAGSSPVIGGTSGGALGTSGNAGGNGGNAPVGSTLLGGGGGGGSGSGNATVAGAGGNGGLYGGGGGGGGSVASGYTTGAGGNGAGGMAAVICF